MDQHSPKWYELYRQSMSSDSDWWQWYFGEALMKLHSSTVFESDQMNPSCLFTWIIKATEAYWEKKKKNSLHFSQNIPIHTIHCIFRQLGSAVYTSNSCIKQDVGWNMRDMKVTRFSATQVNTLIYCVAKVDGELKEIPGHCMPWLTNQHVVF